MYLEDSSKWNRQGVIKPTCWLRVEIMSDYVNYMLVSALNNIEQGLEKIGILERICDAKSEVFLWRQCFHFNFFFLMWHLFRLVFNFFISEFHKLGQINSYAKVTLVFLCPFTESLYLYSEIQALATSRSDLSIRLCCSRMSYAWNCTEKNLLNLIFT